jgi:hypothetical protein
MEEELNRSHAPKSYLRILAYVHEGLRKAVESHPLIQWAGSPVRIQGSFTYGLQTEKSDLDLFVVIAGSGLIDREDSILHVFQETLLRSYFSTKVGDIYRDSSYHTTWVDKLEGLPVSLKLERVAAATEYQLSITCALDVFYSAHVVYRDAVRECIKLLREEDCLNSIGKGIQQRMKTVGFALLCVALKQNYIDVTSLSDILMFWGQFPHTLFGIPIAISSAGMEAKFFERTSLSEEALDLTVNGSRPCARVRYPAWAKVQYVCQLRTNLPMPGNVFGDVARDRVVCELTGQDDGPFLNPLSGPYGALVVQARCSLWSDADFVVAVETREPICTNKVLIVLTGNGNDFAHNLHAYSSVFYVTWSGQHTTNPAWLPLLMRKLLLTIGKNM